MIWDCIVVGAGPAGLSAALTLGRARRSVLVFDTDQPRNAAAQRSHGVLGHDGIEVWALRQRGIAELRRYGVEVIETEIDARTAEALVDGVELGGHTARTAILATGIVEDVPDIAGFPEIYGTSAHTCPYCDGWEHRDERIAVLASPDESLHMAKLLRQWSADIVVLTNGEERSAQQLAELAAIGVESWSEPIAHFTSDRGQLQCVFFGDGSAMNRDALFFHVRSRPRNAIAEAFGCQVNAGGYLEVDEHHLHSSVDRVYGAGNCANPKHNVPLVIADGVRVAVTINERLLDEDLLI